MAATASVRAQTGKRRFLRAGRHHISEGQTTTMNNAEISWSERSGAGFH